MRGDLLFFYTFLSGLLTLKASLDVFVDLSIFALVLVELRSVLRLLFSVS